MRVEPGRAAGWEAAYSGKRDEGCRGVDKVDGPWEVAHVATITTCDSRHRVKVPAAIPGRQYIPDGLKLIEVPQSPVAKPRHPMTEEDVLAAIKASKIEWNGTWQELYAETREP